MQLFISFRCHQLAGEEFTELRTALRRNHDPRPVRTSDERLYVPTAAFEILMIAPNSTDASLVSCQQSISAGMLSN